MPRAVFLDRDGTINREKNYLCDPAELELFPGVPQALRRLRRAGFLLIVITNQSGIGRGYYTEEQMHRVHHRLQEMLEPHEARLDHIYFAPEAPAVPSRGRKPSAQFLFDARDGFGVDLAQSYMIGDKPIDLECGWNGKVKRCLLVRTGYGAEAERANAHVLDRAVIVDDLPAAAEWILRVGEGRADVR